MQFLNHEQRLRVAELAKGRGLMCPICGSRELQPERQAQSALGGTATVLLWCDDTDHMEAAELELSSDEADKLGLNWTRDFPET